MNIFILFSEIHHKLEIKNERCEESEVIYIGKKLFSQFHNTVSIILRFSGSDEEEAVVEDYDQRLFRRSMSVGDLHYLEMALKNATLR